MPKITTSAKCNRNQYNNALDLNSSVFICNFKNSPEFTGQMHTLHTRAQPSWHQSTADRMFPPTLEVDSDFYYFIILFHQNQLETTLGIVISNKHLDLSNPLLHASQGLVHYSGPLTLYYVHTISSIPLPPAARKWRCSWFSERTSTLRKLAHCALLILRKHLYHDILDKSLTTVRSLSCLFLAGFIPVPRLAEVQSSKQCNLQLPVASATVFPATVFHGAYLGWCFVIMQYVQGNF